MNAARAARLRPTAKTHVVEKRVHLERDAAHVAPGDTRARIEIDAQLVGVIEIARPDRVRVQFDAAQVHDPREAGGVVDDELLRGTARRERECHRPQPDGMVRGRAFW